MKSPSREAPEGAVCEAAATLIGGGRESPGLDLRQWAAIASSLPARRRARSLARWTWRLAGPALAAGAAAAWLLVRTAHPALTYVADGFEISSDGIVKTAADQIGRIRFSDGSTIALGGDTHGRIVVPDRLSEARFVLESGAADLDVVHRRATRWVVEAGPFHVDVRGTQFNVSWSPAERHFRLKMRRGEVVVSRGAAATQMVLRSEETLDVADGTVRVRKSEAAESTAPSAGKVDGRKANQAAAVPGGERRVAPKATITTGPMASLESPPPSADLDAGPAIPPSSPTRTTGVVSAVGLRLLANASVSAPVGRRGSPVFIGSNGNLGGPMTGYAWVAGGAETTIDTPSPCDARGCFRDTKGQLCTRGDIPALRCTGQGTAQLSCNWQSNWGSMIGMHTTSSRGPWDATAPGSVSIAYQGRGDHGTYRLTAHVAGDPDSKIYCLDSYQSGQSAEPSMLSTECWTTGGEILGSFRQVDKLALELTSTESPQAFDYCITAIAVNGSAGDASGWTRGGHVAVGDHGKLGGGMTGYAWVAGGTGTVFDSPRSCDQTGCFHDTQGRLCAQGSILPLQCTGQGTPELSCDWQTNWGAMIGLHANLAREAWGATAPATVALTVSGHPAIYRLVAHIAGAPDDQSFCVEDYHSGQAVDARAFKSKCWSASGESLATYQNVDRIALQIMSADDPLHFDVCISDIVLR